MRLYPGIKPKSKDVEGDCFIMLIDKQIKRTINNLLDTYRKIKEKNYKDKFICN